MGAPEIILISLISLFIFIGAPIIIIRNSFINRFLRSIIKPTKKNQLRYLYQKTFSDSYSHWDKLFEKRIKYLLEKYRKESTPPGMINIESRYNGLYYPVFDLDDDHTLNLFRKLYEGNSYAIFKSSKDHYWSIVDLPYKKYKDIFRDINWKISNDSQYVSFCKEHIRLPIRGLYENYERKPKMIDTHGKLSKNFKLFIDMLSTYYNKEGFELSVHKYKNEEMLIRYNRKIKLQNLNNGK